MGMVSLYTTAVITVVAEAVIGIPQVILGSQIITTDIATISTIITIGSLFPHKQFSES